MDIAYLNMSIRSLILTRPILSEDPVGSLLRLLNRTRSNDPWDTYSFVDEWSAYAASLLPYGRLLENYLHDFLGRSENVCVDCKMKGEDITPKICHLMHHEMKVLAEACSVSPSYVLSFAPPNEVPSELLPGWETSQPDLAAWYEGMLNSISKEGFGVFRTSDFLILSGSRIVPAHESSTVTLDQLYGYDWQRRLILDNLRALLRGEPAVNMLLYGDSGTGKSSTIKAAARRMSPDGLRLIEVRPSQLRDIPDLLGTLARQPLKFVIFIDDLSFSEENDDFRALKGTLEGSVLGRADNVIVCATSNRRKLIRESFSERGSDDVHANETIQQQAALADRFGLTIPFMNPSKDAYLRIVTTAAETAGLDVPEDELLRGAERFALEKGGRTGRAAKQYVDMVKSGVLKA